MSAPLCRRIYIAKGMTCACCCRCIAPSWSTSWNFPPSRPCRNVPVRLGPHHLRYSIDQATLPGSKQEVYLLRCPELYDRDGLYGPGDDEHYRFILLSRAAIEMCQRLAFAPDIFHCHDWHTALVPVYLKTIYAWDRLFARTRTVLTIHNIGYQGIFGADILGDLGLDGGTHELHQDDLHGGRINFLKTGVLHADVLTTVSPTYALEIQTDEYGMGPAGPVDRQAWHTRRYPERGGLRALGPAARPPDSAHLLPRQAHRQGQEQGSRSWTSLASTAPTGGR